MVSIMFDHRKYLTDEQKKEIEAITDHNRWMGYKNVRFNLKIWEAFWKYMYQGTFTNNDSAHKVLDYGTGASWSIVTGRALGFDVTGLDIDTDEAKDIFSKFHQIVGVEASHWDGKKMPFSEDCFDVIVSKASLSKLRKTGWETTIAELLRVSKVGATWYIAPEYMYYRIPQELVTRAQVEKDVRFCAWDWNRKDDRNDRFQPARIND